MRIHYHAPRQRQLSDEEGVAGGCGCLLILLLGFIALVASTCGSNDPQSTAPSNPSADSGGWPSTNGQPAKTCPYPNDIYNGISCVADGEPVTVSRAIDGDTVELSDGRQVRLLGVDAPEAGTCGYDEATQFTAAKASGSHVLMFREPGVITDPYGRELAYLDVGELSFADLGRELATNGHAELYIGGEANAEYEATIESAAEAGRYAGPCAEPYPSYTPPPDNYYPVPDGGDDDGGENFYCRRHWYC